MFLGVRLIQIENLYEYSGVKKKFGVNGNFL